MNVNRSDFLKVLEFLTPGLSTRGLQEQSNCFVFTKDIIATYNGEVSCRGPNPVPCIKGAVPADILLSVLRKLVNDEIGIQQKDGELIITVPGKTIKIVLAGTVLLPIDSVPEIEEWADLDSVWLEGSKLVDRCCGTDESEYVMTCVHIHPEYLEASDNYQVARYSVETDIPETLIRGEFLRKARKIEPLQIGRSEAWLHFRNADNVELAARCDDQEYPNLSEYLHVKGQKCKFNKRKTDEAIELASVFLDNDESQEPMVRVSLSPPDVLRIKSASIAGSYSQTIKTTYNGPALSFMMHPELLVALLGQQRQSCVVSANRLQVSSENYTLVTCTTAVED